jgi:hypothetical protein
MSELFIAEDANIYTSTLCAMKYRALNGNPLQPSGHYIYHQIQHSAILRSAHTVYLCALCGSENKQRLFPYTTLIDWFL